MAIDQVTLLLHCWNLPGACFDTHTAVRLGVQRGRDVVDDVSADVKDVTFTVPLRIGDDNGKGHPNFLGPYAHGTPQERFIYLNWGERRNGQWEGFRRAKIMLQDLDPELVEEAVRNSQPIEATIDMTDKKGGPLCARVRSTNIRWGEEQ
jgi:hypothetical protein